MIVTLQEILRLPVLRGARVVAGRRGLAAPVRWCHVAEVLDIARLLSGGELLLATGIALDVPAPQQVAYVEALRERGVAGLMLELGRKFDAVPPAMIEAADRVGLPLIALQFDTPFVKVTEAVHALVLSDRVEPASSPVDQRVEQRLLHDLFAGRITENGDLRRRLEETGRTFSGTIFTAVLCSDLAGDAAPLRLAATGLLGRDGWLPGAGEQERRLVAFGPDPEGLAEALRTLALRLAPVAAGVGRAHADPRSVGESLEEGRQTMRLRRVRPHLAPLFAETGLYQLIPGLSTEVVQEFVNGWLGPLLQYDRVHRSDLCETLRQLLDDRLAVARAAEHLHLTRQGLYHRQRRIADVVGRDLEDPEVRVALSVALRLRDVLAANGSVPVRTTKKS